MESSTCFVLKMLLLVFGVVVVSTTTSEEQMALPNDCTDGKGGPGCVTDDSSAAANLPVRRKRSADSRLYSILIQKLLQQQLQDLPASWPQSSDYDYVYEQGQAIPPYHRKRNTGRCYFHAINCW